MNNWLISWFVEENDVTVEYKEERQYIADALQLLQREILSAEGLQTVRIEPIGWEVGLSNA